MEGLDRRPAFAGHGGPGHGPYLVDLYVLPVLLSCVVFRSEGLAVLPLALLGYHLTTAWHGGLPWQLLLANDLGQMLEWCVLAAFV